MTKNIRETAQYKKEYTLMVKQLNEILASDDPCEDDPVWQRAIELGRDKHLPLGKAIEMAEKEFSNK